MTEQKLESYQGANGERNMESRVADLEVRNTSACNVICLVRGRSRLSLWWEDIQSAPCGKTFETRFELLGSYFFAISTRGLIFAVCSEDVGLAQVHESLSCF